MLEPPGTTEEAGKGIGVHAKKIRGQYVNIGSQKERWLEIKSKKRCKSDEDLASLLIKSLHHLNKWRRVSSRGITHATRRRRNVFTQHSHRVLVLENDVWLRWRDLKLSLQMNNHSQLASVLIDTWFDRANYIRKICDDQQTISEDPTWQDNTYTDMSSGVTDTSILTEFPCAVKVEKVTDESAEDSDSDTEIEDIMNYANGEKKLVKLTEEQTESSVVLEKRRKSSRVQSRGYRPDYANLDWKEESGSDTETVDSKPDWTKVVIKQTNKRKKQKTSADLNEEDSGKFIDNMWSVWGESSNTKRQRKKTKKSKEEDPDFVVSDDDIKDVDISDGEKEVDVEMKVEQEMEIENLSEIEKKKVIKERKKNNSDSSINKKYKRKRIKKEKLDEERRELDTLEKKSKAKKKIKKEKTNITESVKKPWVHIKLEEHQEKYRMEIVGSFERKNRNINLTEELYTCLMCGRFKSTAKEIFEEHIEKHVNKVLECDRCTFVGRSEIELMKHKISSGHMPKGHQYMCDICGMVLYTWDSRLSHMGKEHDDPQFKCKFCEMKFVTRLKRQQHTRTIHVDAAQFCNSCKTDCQTLSAEEFKEHQNTCKPGHQCQVCGIVLASKSGLHSHLRSTHMGVRKYQCQICPYAGKSAQRLREHEMTHNSVHPYSCDKCTFTCVQACQLKSHMRTHSGEKPYKCSQCKFAAAWNVQLKEHVKIHGMETSVVCLKCDILFKNAKALKIHEKKDHSSLSLLSQVTTCFNSSF
ncbi:zinc finger protein 37-like [Mercenaria mercenaria]|uniref:zinc finger protein 37-like n=1 Tax=Mercenaria mercenaria TaxID=6596 RepID=UPI00234EB6EC|nr:zinc finger protein 37-like [Mercenaria mercenaria]